MSVEWEFMSIRPDGEWLGTLMTSGFRARAFQSKRGGMGKDFLFRTVLELLLILGSVSDYTGVVYHPVPGPELLQSTLFFHTPCITAHNNPLC